MLHPRLKNPPRVSCLRVLASEKHSLSLSLSRRVCVSVFEGNPKAKRSFLFSELTTPNASRLRLSPAIERNGACCCFSSVNENITFSLL